MRPTLAAILSAVAQAYGLTPTDLTGRRTTRIHALPRQIAMWLARELTAKSYPEIGRAIGGRDHTTVMHGVRVVGERLAGDVGLGERVRRIRAGLV